MIILSALLSISNILGNHESTSRNQWLKMSQCVSEKEPDSKPYLLSDAPHWMMRWTVNVNRESVEQIILDYHAERFAQSVVRLSVNRTNWSFELVSVEPFHESDLQANLQGAFRRLMASGASFHLNSKDLERARTSQAKFLWQYNRYFNKYWRDFRIMRYSIAAERAGDMLDGEQHPAPAVVRPVTWVELTEARRRFFFEDGQQLYTEMNRLAQCLGT